MPLECTFRLAKVLSLEFLLAIPRGIYVALAAWCATLAGVMSQITVGRAE